MVKEMVCSDCDSAAIIGPTPVRLGMEEEQMICEFIVKISGVYHFCGVALFPSSHEKDACYICPEHGCRVVGHKHEKE